MADHLEIIEYNEKDYLEEEIISLSKAANHTFDIEVENDHHYILENGIVSHNTISLSVGQNCSSGIEPVFSLYYDRNIRTGHGDETKKERVYDYAWLEYLDYAKANGLSDEKPAHFVTTLDIDPYAGVDVQAVWQKYIDHSISKTANLPMGYTLEQYKDLFLYSYKKGLKGFTSFNPQGCGSPETQVLTTSGIKTFEEIFEAEGIDIYDEQNKGWVDLRNNLEFYDESGNPTKINKAFIKGLTSNMLNIKLENGETLCVSPEHKFMIDGVWTEAKDIKEGDDLDVYKGELGKG